MQFWTTDEFKKFLGKVSDKPQARAGFLILYYTGLRIGELLALEYGDIDFKNCTINVNKSYQHIRGKDVVTPPKTPKSVRIVSCGTRLETIQNGSTASISTIGFSLIPNHSLSMK